MINGITIPSVHNRFNLKQPFSPQHNASPLISMDLHLARFLLIVWQVVKER